MNAFQKRLIIFIDNSNMFRGSRDEGIRFDYQKIATFLSTKAIEPYDLMRVLVYCTIDGSKTPEEIQREKDLYQKFSRFRNFNVKTYDLKLIRDATGAVIKKREKGVDVALVTDLLLLASRGAYDVAIVCAGDADMIQAVTGVIEMGKQVYVAAFDSSCSDELKKCALDYISLTENESEISI